MEGKDSNGREYHVLIADDEPEIRSLLRDWLNEEVRKQLPGTYVIYEAEDGQKAIEKVGECKASGRHLGMAIIDLRMPGKNGFQTIDELLQVSPETEVMVLSATTDLFIQRLRGYGAKVTPMAKPVSLKNFIETAATLLQRVNSYE